VSLITDKIKKLFTKSEYDAGRELGKLGTYVVQDGRLKYRVSATQELLEQIHLEDNPIEKVKAYDKLVQAAAAPWQRAKNSSAAIRMFIHWEALLSMAKWLALYWEEIGAESTEEGRSIKKHLNLAIDLILQRGAKIIVESSFADQDVAPQFIAVLRQEGMLPFVGPSPKVQPMFVSEAGGGEG